jgi:hypothetical protein
VAQVHVKSTLIAAGKEENNETSVRMDGFRFYISIATYLLRSRDINSSGTKWRVKFRELRRNLHYSTCNFMFSFI